MRIQVKSLIHIGNASQIRNLSTIANALEAAESHPIARARLTIDLDAIVANWRALDALSGPGVETAAVVKADGYGLGAGPVGRALAASGVASFFVALAEEGASLRAALGPGPRIHVFDGLMRGDEALCREHELIPCLDSVEQVTAFASDCLGMACALQIDSGMNRLGLERADLERIAPLLPRLDLRLALSHLACADDPAHPQNAAQRDDFAAACVRLPGGVRRSLAATGGVLLGPAFHHELTRPGIGLYGGAPFAAARPVVRLALPVVQVRDVAPGESVGYGAAWTATRPSRIATLSAGYADGLPRAMGGGGVKLYAGTVACPLVGRVSMDLITVDVTDLAEVPDTLEILNERQGVDDLAAAAGTIGYEILTGLGARFDRVYLHGSRDPGPER